MNDLQKYNATEYAYINAEKIKKTTQKELVLDYLQKYGSITPLESIYAIGCYRLGARIWDLRKDGWQISTEKEGGRNYAVYKLEGWPC